MKRNLWFAGIVLSLFVCWGGAHADDIGVIDHGLLGVADLSFAAGDLTAIPTAAGWVDNILQLTQWESSDYVQCWGANPWDTTGEWIVYTSYRYPSNGEPRFIPPTESNEICKMKADGTEFMQLTSNNSCDSHASFVPPNNDKVIFQRDSNYGNAEIWVKDANDQTDASEYNLTQNHFGPVDGSCENKPVVSHNGQKIVFRTCYEDLWVMNIDGTFPVPITSGYNATKHTWSNDDSWVLFSSDPYYNGSRIFRADVPVNGIDVQTLKNNVGVTQLSDENMVITLADQSSTAGWKCENWPSLSPDGNWVAFHTNYDYNVSTLSIMPATGSDGDDVIHLVIQGFEDGDDWYKVCGPNSWSPDSKWIAFKMWAEGQYNAEASQLMAIEEGQDEDNTGANIFAINIDTREIIQLTKDFGDYRMWWSPAGDKILFRDGRYGNWYSRDYGDYGDDLLVINLSIPTCEPAGDINGDGLVNTADLNILLANLNKKVPEAYPCSDLNGDGMITVLDVRQIVSINPLLARDTRIRRILR